MKQSYRSELMTDYLCSMGRPRSAADVLEYLRGNVTREGFFYE
jgi:hypothetical protein